VHLTGLVGHQGASACRVFCGLKGRRKPGGKTYYPALLKPSGYDVKGSNHPDVHPSNIQGPSETRYLADLQYLLRARGVTDYGN
jgi:hypothetical protein